MIKKGKYFEKIFYGSTVIGEKGQIVVPKEIRDKLKLKKGDKLLVFLMGDDMITLIKLSDFEKITKYMEKNLNQLRKIIKKIGQK